MIKQEQKMNPKTAGLFQKVFFLAIFLFCAPSMAEDTLPNSAFSFSTHSQDDALLHYYIGIFPGIGQESGTQYPMNSGFAYGGTFGMEFKKSFGAALTYEHNSFSYSDTNVTSTVSQIMLEANIFSLLVLNGGFHLAEVIKVQPGFRTADLGFGLHIGLDVSLTSHISAGFVGYWTLVGENEDHHSILNLMLPLKFWF
jgi:hypothetical protein